MNKLKIVFVGLIMVLIGNSCTEMNKSSELNKDDVMMVRIAEIEIDSIYIDEYIAILKEEAAASVRLEPGVICIYPMFMKERPTNIRLLEIYANKAAYESHLQSPHFITYKTTTLKMVKSLNLVAMQSIDEEMMVNMFKKIDP